MNTSSPETENFVYRPPHENLNAATQWRWTRWTRLAFKTLIQQSSCKSNMFHGFSWIHHDSPLEQHWNIGILAISVRQCPRNTWFWIGWASMASNSSTSTAAAVPTAMTVLQDWHAKNVRGRLMEMRLVTVSGSESPGKHLMNYVEHCLQYHIETGYIGNIICTYLYHPGKNLWWHGEVGSARMDWNFSYIPCMRVCLSVLFCFWSVFVSQPDLIVVW